MLLNLCENSNCWKVCKLLAITQITQALYRTHPSFEDDPKEKISISMLLPAPDDWFHWSLSPCASVNWPNDPEPDSAMHSNIILKHYSGPGFIPPGGFQVFNLKKYNLAGLQHLGKTQELVLNSAGKFTI